MIRSIICVLAIGLCLQGAYAQNAADLEAVKMAREEIKERKANALNSLVPSDFGEPDSFGKGAKFLGALYAGTVFVSSDCSGPLPAPDDFCVQYVPGGPPMGPAQIFHHPEWSITIPGNTASNVIYPMLNNSVFYASFAGATGRASVLYTPVVTIESIALNDPAAVDANGNPLNGSYTAFLSGSLVRDFHVTEGEYLQNNESYATVAGQGLSRAYFRRVGLPNHVINELFKKPMTLRFKIRMRVTGQIDDAHFSYTFRLLGQ